MTFSLRFPSPCLWKAGARVVATVLLFSLVSQVSAYEQSTALVEVPNHPEAFEQFEIASVRQNKSDDKPFANFPLGVGAAYATTGGHFRATNIPLFSYIAFAYKLTSVQMTALLKHAPEWIEERYDIEAKSSSLNPTKDEMRSMMLALLAERFHLVIHQETRERPLYVLTVVEGNATGPHLKPHPLNSPCAVETLGHESVIEPAFKDVKTGSLPQSCGGVAPKLAPSHPDRIRVGGRDIGIDLLAKALSELSGLGLPVKDGTNLKGSYDFVLEWSPEVEVPLGASEPPKIDSSGPSFQDALQQQLGLKLVKQQGQETEYVLDHVERPDPN